MTSPSLQKFKRWAALLRAEGSSLGHSLESYAMDWEADLSASREDRRHEPASGEAQPLTDERGALEKIVSSYDAYRRRGVAPAPGEYADLVRAIDAARAALAAQPAPVAPEDAFEAGWTAAANWAGRGDLLADVGSPAYQRDRGDAMRLLGHPAPSAAPAQPTEEDVTDIAFEAWWLRAGQFCRAGGGDYEKTFAYRAWHAPLEIPCAAPPAAQPVAAPRESTLPDGWVPLAEGYARGLRPVVPETSLLEAAREVVSGSTPPRTCADDCYHVPAHLWLTLQGEVMERLRELARADLVAVAQRPAPPAAQPVVPAADDESVAYPRDFFSRLIHEGSPYAFYIFQWVPYQTDAKRWRLKLQHDVRTFDGREALNVWPNGSHCGPFRDDEVEFIRISRSQFGEAWKDPRPDRAAAPSAALVAQPEQPLGVPAQAPSGSSSLRSCDPSRDVPTSEASRDL